MSHVVNAELGGLGRLDQLERRAPGLLAAGRPDVLAGELDELLQLDFSAHPLARLLVGAACHDVYRGDPRAEQLVVAAWQQLETSDDDHARGLAANVRANVAYGRGDVAGALEWWRRTHDLLDADVPLCAAALAHLSQEAYARGDLTTAVQVAADALTKVEDGTERDYELVPLVYLALYNFWLGDFRCVETLVNQADAVWQDVRHRGTRNEGPLVEAFRAALLAIRGDLDAAARCFTDAIELARQLRTPWYEVMARAARAEALAARTPSAALADARRAVEDANALGDRGWVALSRLAEGIALGELGEQQAADRAFSEAMEAISNPFERARVELARGELRLASSDLDGAARSFGLALDVFDGAGCAYWAARACIGLAEADRTRSRMWRERAGSVGGDEVAVDVLASRSRGLRVRLAGSPSVWIGRCRVRFLTTHAERALGLLVLAGPRGVPSAELAEWMWPRAPVPRRGPRLRTLLWQIRAPLGEERWRLIRRDDHIWFDSSGVIVEHEHDGRGALDGCELDDVVELLVERQDS